MRISSLKTLDLILSLSKDEAKISCFFSILTVPPSRKQSAPGDRVQKPKNEELGENPCLPQTGPAA